LRREAIGRYHILLLGAFLVIGLVVPMTAMGAGDDCPPPSEQPFEDPGYIENEDPPVGGGDGDGEDGEETTESGTEDGGVFGSLGSVSTGQLTIGILAVVGVIVGAAYIVMVGRVDDEDEE